MSKRYVLVKAGSDKRAVDPQGHTPLHFVVNTNSYHIARFLVRNAAPITVHDVNGKTPLDYCHGEIMQELRKIAQNHDVFISYTHSDMAFARKVRMELERNCIKWEEKRRKRGNRKRELKEKKEEVNQFISWMDDQRLEAESDWRADIAPLDHLPSSLLHLLLGNHFNQPLDNLPSSLTSSLYYHLKIWTELQPSSGHLPPSLPHLSLSFDIVFNKPIDNLPPSLKSLSFTTLSVFSQPIDHLPSLTHLELPNRLPTTH